MLLEGFSLEILVNNVPLPEVTEQVESQKVNVFFIRVNFWMFAWFLLA
jgi:hypothetical protein